MRCMLKCKVALAAFFCFPFDLICGKAYVDFLPPDTWNRPFQFSFVTSSYSLGCFI